MSRPPLAALLRTGMPGFSLCLVVAAAAQFLAAHYHAPVMLFALLLGMALNFLGEEGQCQPGIELTARSLLRLGVALLGLRITLGQVEALGWHTVVIVVGAVLCTIAASVLAAWLCGFHPLFGLLSGGATAICGASAALALSAALPAHPVKERATVFTVVGVSALSTMAMVAYPLLVQALGLTPGQAGVFLGGTIHDVAQVVGAGYSISSQVGDAAVVVKLMRVAMLLPVIVLAAFCARRAGGQAGEKRPPLLPGFALAFAALAAINSTGVLPAALQQAGVATSQWCMVAAVAAIGMKARLKELLAVGWKPILLLLAETAFMAGLVALLLHSWR